MTTTTHPPCPHCGRPLMRARHRIGVPGWFVCADCDWFTHAAVCVDDEGRLECICGLAEFDRSEADELADAAARRTYGGLR
jgi:hypothetical protein